MAKDAKLVKILEAPSLSSADKSAIIAELEKFTGANETVKHFLSTLAENNRLSLLGGVCTKFGELMSAGRGEVEMTVTSATVRVNHTYTHTHTLPSPFHFSGRMDGRTDGPMKRKCTRNRYMEKGDEGDGIS